MTNPSTSEDSRSERLRKRSCEVEDVDEPPSKKNRGGDGDDSENSAENSKPSAAPAVVTKPAAPPKVVSPPKPQAVSSDSEDTPYTQAQKTITAHVSEDDDVSEDEVVIVKVTPATKVVVGYNETAEFFRVVGSPSTHAETKRSNGTFMTGGFKWKPAPAKATNNKRAGLFGMRQAQKSKMSKKSKRDDNKKTYSTPSTNMKSSPTSKAPPNKPRSTSAKTKKTAPTKKPASMFGNNKPDQKKNMMKSTDTKKNMKKKTLEKKTTTKKKNMFGDFRPKQTDNSNRQNTGFAKKISVNKKPVAMKKPSTTTSKPSQRRNDFHSRNKKQVILRDKRPAGSLLKIFTAPLALLGHLAVQGISTLFGKRGEASML